MSWYLDCEFINYVRSPSDTQKPLTYSVFRPYFRNRNSHKYSFELWRYDISLLYRQIRKLTLSKKAGSFSDNEYFFFIYKIHVINIYA